MAAPIPLKKNLGQYQLHKFNLEKLLQPQKQIKLMGPRGVEPLTSSLSGTRSNQLSYGPNWLARPFYHEHIKKITAKSFHIHRLW